MWIFTPEGNRYITSFLAWQFLQVCYAIDKTLSPFFVAGGDTDSSPSQYILVTGLGIEEACLRLWQDSGIRSIMPLEGTDAEKPGVARLLAAGGALATPNLKVCPITPGLCCASRPASQLYQPFFQIKPISQ